MATWPSTLPSPRRPDYALEAGDATGRTDMDVGPARVRRRTTSAPDKVTLGFVLTDDQMSTFRAFWDGDWAAGAAWVFVPIKDGRTAGIVSRECRPMTAKFRATLLSSVSWLVVFDVEVRHA